LRHAVAALALALMAALGATASASAATTGPRVVIIVGATHGATAGYRTAADRAYTEAIKYTSNVVKVYSPNATWSRVKAATVGASVVIYFGHGNGWPSPYTYDPKYTTKDGFGLNATAGAGDYNNKYYGEPYVATLDLAPNAVIILSRLCYASGNSEPGGTTPTQAVARQRVDNYAAGFLKGKARAVIADGHGEPGPYLRALFTTHATIQQAWRSAPNFHGHEKSYASSRTPGATAYTDTDLAASGYYRSLVTKPGLTTDDVTGFAGTAGDPSSFVIPGKADVGSAGAALYDDAALTVPAGDPLPSAPLPTGTRLRLSPPVTTTTSIGGSSVHVDGLDDPAITGWMALADLRPRDSRPPAVWTVDTGLGVFSPALRAQAITARLSEPAAWRVRILDGDTVLATMPGDGSDVSATWSGLGADGAPVPDGRYTYAIDATDAWDNTSATKTGTVRVDTVGAPLASLTPDTDVVRWFAPNGDGYRDTATWTASRTESESVTIRILHATGLVVRRLTQAPAAGPLAFTWDGRNTAGAVVPDGVYEVRVSPRDVAGNAAPTDTRSIRVDTTFGSVTSSKSLFYPQDGDALARATSLGFKLARPATVTLTVRDSTGAVVRTLIAAEARTAGAWMTAFDGRRDDATMLPTGRYTAAVTATDATTTVSQSVAFQMDAFAIAPSDSTPARGQRLTVSASSAETLSAAPRLIVRQPGVVAWSVAMTKLSTYRYMATITLRTGHSAGNVTFEVRGVDTNGQQQHTTRTYALH
jgi:flagellar hook assembly protein FlgD